MNKDAGLDPVKVSQTSEQNEVLVESEDDDGLLQVVEEIDELEISEELENSLLNENLSSERKSAIVPGGIKPPENEENTRNIEDEEKIEYAHKEKIDKGPDKEQEEFEGEGRTEKVRKNSETETETAESEAREDYEESGLTERNSVLEQNQNAEIVGKRGDCTEGTGDNIENKVDEKDVKSKDQNEGAGKITTMEKEAESDQTHDAHESQEDERTYEVKLDDKTKEVQEAKATKMDICFSGEGRHAEP